MVRQLFRLAIWISLRISLCIALGGITAAHAGVVTWPAGPEIDAPAAVGFADVLEDPSGQWRLPDVMPGGVAASRFHASTGALASFGFTRSAYWFRFQIHNPSSQPRTMVLVLPTNWLDDIQIYPPLAEAQRTVGPDTAPALRLGDTRPFSARSYPSPEFRVPLHVPAGLQTYYLRITCAQAFATPIELWTPAARAQEERRTAAYFGMFYGVLVVMVLYNGFIWLATRDGNYAFYCLYLLSFLMMNLGYNGFAFQYLWPESPRWSNWSHTLWIFLYQCVALRFAMRFLDSRRQMPHMHGALRVGLGLTLMAWVAICLIGDPVLYNAVPVYALYLNTPLILVAGVVAWCAGFRAARFFVLAAMASLVGCLCTALTVTGLLPYRFLTFHAAEFGILADVVLLSLALADRISMLRQEREAAERAVRLEQKQTAVLLAQANVQLERTVDHRTAELSRLRDEAERLARTDGLTGVPNRRSFEEHALSAVNHARQHEQALSMVLFDIDLFKCINDRWGHPVGDAVIRSIAQTAQQTLRGPDFLARIGGEEFALLLPGVTMEQARITAERLRETVAATPVLHDAIRLEVSASFGVSELAPDEVQYGPLLRRADKAMYLAKQNGRNCVAALPAGVSHAAPPRAA